MNHFRKIEFFVCPKCDSPIVERNRFLKHFGHGQARFCPQCGKEIASAYEEALTLAKSDSGDTAI